MSGQRRQIRTVLCSKIGRSSVEIGKKLRLLVCVEIEHLSIIASICIPIGLERIELVEQCLLSSLDTLLRSNEASYGEGSGLKCRGLTLQY